MHTRGMCALRCAVVVLSALCVSSTARAAFTPINQPPSWDATHADIFNAVYGPNFFPTGPLGLDFTNGAVTAVRVHDTSELQPTGQDVPAVTSVLGTLGEDDQHWVGSFDFASAQAVWGVFAQEFGYFDGDSGGTYHKLFDAQGYAFDVTGSADLSQIGSGVIRWARGGEDRILSSYPADNLDGMDHMVTYRIEGLQDGKATWIVMFEDKTPWDDCPDWDYEDLVVEIKANPINVPEPTTAAIGAIVLLGSLRIRRRS